MYLSVDIGGTKTSLALFSNFGIKKQNTKFTTPANPADLPTALQGAIAKLFPDMASRSKVKMAIIAYPGIIENGAPITAPNLPSWSGFDLVTTFRTLFTNNAINCPFYFENDANLGAFYEARNQKGKSIYLTFSTGVGGGIIENGQISALSATFEPGHYPFTYNNQPGTWEQFASVRAINTAYHVDDVKKITDLRALFDISSRVSLGLTQVIREQNPSRIIIGGPIGLIWRGISKQIIEQVKSATGPSTPVKVAVAKKPMECVEYGCYYYAKAIEKALKAKQN